MNNPETPDSVTLPEKSSSNLAPSQYWFYEDACILDLDYFVKTLTAIKSKGVQPDLLGSIITHYASKWLPDLIQTGPLSSSDDPTQQSITALWTRKRFFVETLVGILPPEQDSIPCNFLLRLIRIANMVGVDPTYRAELEKRVSWQLDQASLKELMIPSFSHTCGTVLDVELVIRLVKGFMAVEDGVRSGIAVVKVIKLIDSYLAEAAIDANLGLPEFLSLAGALPNHARATDDGLYRAIDTYLKVHPNTSKQERKTLCKLMDSRNLSPEASLHASQNERLPVRALIQVLFSEQNKVSNNYNGQQHIGWSGQFSETRSPNINGVGLELPVRCHSKREISARHIEIKRLKEDVVRLQSQFNSMQVLMERMLEEKKKARIFKWMKFGMLTSKSGGGSHGGGREEEEVGFGQQTPMDSKTKVVRSGIRTSITKTRTKSIS